MTTVDDDYLNGQAFGWALVKALGLPEGVTKLQITIDTSGPATIAVERFASMSDLDCTKKVLEEYEIVKRGASKP